MLCEICNQKNANVFIQKIENGKKIELKICDECAMKEGHLMNLTPTNMSSFFAELLNLESDMGQKKDIVVKPCPSCNTSYKEFMETGLIGCAKCVDTFRPYLDPVLKKVHGSTEHIGKIPRSFGGDLIKKRKIENLRKELNEAVKLENYEKAASLRDKIREIEKEI